jgi:hypothetical protein
VGQAGSIIVQGASATTTLGMASSSEIITLTDTLPSRFLLEHASSLKFYSVPPIANELQALIDQVPGRLLLQSASANSTIVFTYPVAAMADTTPPQVSQIGVSPLGPASVSVTWQSDEYTAGSVAYGTQPGAYSQTASDPQWYRQHAMTLNNLNTGGTYYYRLTNTDRSGNSVQSGELTFTLQGGVRVFLPLIRR